MNKLNLSLAVLIILMIMTGCGIHYPARGRVVDAQTNEPIEGAAVIVHWVGVKAEALIAPYASGEYTLEIAEDVTDKNGKFTIPKYPLADHYEMGVYKDGYACWASDSIVIQYSDSKDYGKERTGFHLGNGMKIKLEPFTDTAREFEHAAFIDAFCGSLKCEQSQDKIFYEAISEQLILYYQYRKKMREEYRKKGK